jgi:hypothetical protein
MIDEQVSTVPRAEIVFKFVQVSEGKLTIYSEAVKLR